MTTTAADEIWAILRELAESRKETERLIKDLFASQQETNRKFQETDRKLD